MRQDSMPVRSLPTLQNTSTGSAFSAAADTTCRHACNVLQALVMGSIYG